MFIVTDTSKLEQYGFKENVYCSNFWAKKVKKEEGIILEYAVNPDNKINDNRLCIYAIIDDVGVVDTCGIVRDDFELLGKLFRDGVVKYVET